MPIRIPIPNPSLTGFVAIMVFKNTRRFCLLVILTNLHATVDAQIFKCKGENDSYIVQGTPCAAGTRSLDEKKSSSEKAGATVPWKRKYEGPGGNWDPQRAPAAAVTYPSPPAPSLPDPAPANPPATASYGAPRQNKVASNPAQLTETNAYKELEAFNKMQHCNYERQQLNVLKEGRRIYSVDNKGDRQYVEDANRPAKTAEAERRVATACN